MLRQLRQHQDNVSAFHERVREHLADEEFDEQVEAFMEQNARRVSAGSQVVDAKRSQPMEGEFSLQSHSIFKLYLELMEKHWEGFCKEEGITQIELQERLKRLIDVNVQGEGPTHFGTAIMLKYMIAAWDFDKFIDRCQEWCDDHNIANKDSADNLDSRKKSKKLESKNSQNSESKHFVDTDSKIEKIYTK